MTVPVLLYYFTNTVIRGRSLNFEKIDPQSALPLYAQIIEVVKEGILLEELHPGDALPSVRSLANQLKVNSLTIQKAYKLLESEGVIEIKKGVGAFVNKETKPLQKKSKYQIIEEDFYPTVQKAKSMNLELIKIKEIIEKQWSKK